MPPMLSLLYLALLPILATLPALARLRRAQAAHTRGLLRPPGWHWLLAGLTAAQALIWLALLSLIYPTRLEWPLAALLALAVLVVAAHSARAHAHPGLHGLRRPLPRDGLDLIEREQRAARRPFRARLWARIQPVAPLLPALLVLASLAALAPARWFSLALLALTLTAPLLLIPYRRLWLLPLGLALPLGVLLSQALVLRPSLPPGWWTQPLTTAHCLGALSLAGDPPRAWCVDVFRAQVAGFDPASGRLAVRADVPEAVRLFAANGPFAWVQQNPAQGLVRVGAEGVRSIRVGSAQTGAADPQGRLWVIDVSQELSLYQPDGTEQRLRAADGLLNNTANVVRVSPAGDVWVGSFNGLSVLRAGAADWQTIDRAAGAPGVIHSLAFGPDGGVWMLWQPRPGYGVVFDWGLSALYPDGTWVHRALGPETQLELSRSEHPLAIDSQGRAWFVTQSLPRHERYLGLVTSGQPPQVYPLGPFPAAGPYAYSGPLWRDTYGVLNDGQGGIILYRGPEEGWWRWRP